MHGLTITFAMVIAIALIHFSYVDFRFRYRDGILWFWLLKPAPLLMWASRATVVIAALMALLTPVIGVSETYVYLIAGVVGLHILSMILLEVLEPR